MGSRRTEDKRRELDRLYDRTTESRRDGSSGHASRTKDSLKTCDEAAFGAYSLNKRWNEEERKESKPKFPPSAKCVSVSGVSPRG